MKSDFVRIADTKIHYYTWGSESLPKLFFFHGFKDVGATFKYVCEDLQNRFFCVAPDWRGFGDSDWSRNAHGYFYFEYLADLHQILEFFSPDEAIQAVAHSMGGNILSLYAGLFPSRISRLINLEGIGLRDMKPEEWPQRMKDWILGQSKIQPSIYSSWAELERKIQATYPRIPRERIQAMARFLAREENHHIVLKYDPRHKWINPSLFRLDQASEVWKKIQAKTLLIMSEHCEFISVVTESDDPSKEIQKRIQSFPSHFQVEEKKEVGHMMHLENPKWLSQRIIRFLCEEA